MNVAIYMAGQWALGGTIMKKIFIVCSVTLVLSLGAKFVLAGAADLPSSAMKPNAAKPAFKPMAEVPYYGDFKYNKFINNLPPKFEGEPKVLFKYTNDALTNFSVKIDLNIANGYKGIYIWGLKVSTGAIKLVDTTTNDMGVELCDLIKNDEGVIIKASCEFNQKLVTLQNKLTFELWHDDGTPKGTADIKIVDLSAFEKVPNFDVEAVAAGAFDIAKIEDVKDVLAQVQADAEAEQSLDDVPGSGVYIAAVPPDGGGSVAASDDKSGAASGTECNDPSVCGSVDWPGGVVIDTKPIADSDGGCSMIAGASPNGLSAVLLLAPAILALALRRKKA